MQAAVRRRCKTTHSKSSRRGKHLRLKCVRCVKPLCIFSVPVHLHNGRIMVRVVGRARRCTVPLCSLSPFAGEILHVRHVCDRKRVVTHEEAADTWPEDILNLIVQYAFTLVVK